MSESNLEEQRRGARTLVEFAFNDIRQAILSGKLAPGSRLRVEQLKAEYRVGSSTLREALSLLVAESLVTMEGQKGFRVAPSSIADLRHITEMRKLLETHALRVSIEKGTDEWEAGVVAAYHRLSRVEERLYERVDEVFDEWESRNRAFHEALIAACDNTWLRHFRTILYQQSERYRRMSIRARQIPRDVRPEHRAIMEAALARDAERACQLSADHIERTLTNLVGLLAAPAPAPPRAGAGGGT